MRRVVLIGFVLAAAACTTHDPSSDAPSKDRARNAQDGKADTVDFCEEYGWYGDGVCDAFCLDPDPDCDPGPDAESCGGLAGLVCSDADSYCHYEVDQTCGAADQLGTCTPIPQFCTAEIDPVCGCDGVTYQNSCQANSEGVSVASEGPCSAQCDPDLVCAQVITCVDGIRYPTACGPANCDEPLGPCDVDPQPSCDPTLICPQVITCVDGQQYPTGCGPANCDAPIGPCDDSPGTCDPNMVCAQVLTCVDGEQYPTACGPANCDAPIGPCDTGATCEGACGGAADDGSCYCDTQCEAFGDCCDDYASVCQ